MRIKFIAYDPVTGEKIKLKAHVRKDEVHGTKVYYCDENGNFACNRALKGLFEAEHYPDMMEVEINNKVYYLIGEY